MEQNLIFNSDEERVALKVLEILDGNVESLVTINGAFDHLFKNCLISIGKKGLVF